MSRPPSVAAEVPAGARIPPRYTRKVRASSHRWIGVLLLVVLAVLPASGTVCAALCVPAVDAATPIRGHAADAPCHDAASDGAGLRGMAGHDCGRHDGIARDVAASLTPSRSDAGALSAGGPVALPAPYPAAPHPARVRSGPGAPPGTGSPTGTPLVLRI